MNGPFQVSSYLISNKDKFLIGSIDSLRPRFINLIYILCYGMQKPELVVLSINVVRGNSRNVNVILKWTHLLWRFFFFIFIKFIAILEKLLKTSIYDECVLKNSKG